MVINSRIQVFEVFEVTKAEQTGEVRSEPCKKGDG